jgi:hypothetical protein
MDGFALDPALVDWHGADGLDYRAIYRRRIRDRLRGRGGAVLVFRPRFRSLRDLVVFASGKSNDWITKVLNMEWNATALTAPASQFFALWTATLDKTSTGATAGEAAYTGYTRVTVTSNTTNFPASSGGSNIQNATAITWPAAGSGPTTCTFIAVLDSATIGAGNIRFWGSITSTVVANGDTPQINVNGLTASEL